MKLARLHAAAASEPYWHVQLAILAAIVLQLLLSNQLTVGPKFIIAGAEAVLLAALTIFTSDKRRSAVHIRRTMAILLIIIVSVANISSLLLIINELFSNHSITGKELLVSGLSVYLTNIIIFGLWYWELDDPNAANSKEADDVSNDFLFPQSAYNRRWAPTFFDYLYVSITNASAFSPTDTMPLTHRAKLLMTLQSLTSLVTVALVAARAVNILA